MKWLAKWLILVALVLAGTVLLVILIGALLPRKHVVSRSVSLPRQPEVVWDLITGPPAWRPDIQGYQELPASNDHRMWRETDQHGQTITFEAVEVLPPRRLVTHIADPKLPFGGSWTYEITPTGTGCSLTITENGEVYNPLFRFVSRFIIGHTAAIDAYIKALTAKLA
ncbi:MAG TPA: SRPBCC family protein [Candidatus Angelobacter sp.]